VKERGKKEKALEGEKKIKRMGFEDSGYVVLQKDINAGILGIN